MTDLSDLQFRKSSRSAQNNACLEVAKHPDGGIVLRNSTKRQLGALPFTDLEWEAFLVGAKAGEFDNLLD